LTDERHRSDGVLLTGVTGFLGMELLARYMERSERRVFVLIRGASERIARERLDRTLTYLFGHAHPYAERVVPVRGDLTRVTLGVRRGRSSLAEQINEIVHGAASVSFELDLESSRAINVEGTRRMVELAERCQARGGLRRFIYVSTAFVAGDHRGCFSEDDLDVGQRFHNSYEQSKFEAERLVASRRASLPVTVARPSIIVGERSTGWTTSFNVLYWPLRAYARGAYRALPGRRDASVDVVPIDYVADAIYALSRAREAENATFHVTAGRHASSVGELVDLASDFFARPAPVLLEPQTYRHLVHPLLMRVAHEERTRRTLRRSEMFFPYFASRVTFDDRRTRIALRGSGIRVTPLRTYFDRLLEYALAADWGRRQLPRKRAVGVPPPRILRRRPPRVRVERESPVLVR
jgi:long-chain acyl-CoA synthetase